MTSPPSNTRLLLPFPTCYDWAWLLAVFLSFRNWVQIIAIPGLHAVLMLTLALVDGQTSNHLTPIVRDVLNDSITREGTLLRFLQPHTQQGDVLHIKEVSLSRALYILVLLVAAATAYLR
jgi:hypothetical protein